MVGSPPGFEPRTIKFAKLFVQLTEQELPLADSSRIEPLQDLQRRNAHLPLLRAADHQRVIDRAQLSAAIALDAAPAVGQKSARQGYKRRQVACRAAVFRQNRAEIGPHR